MDANVGIRWARDHVPYAAPILAFSVGLVALISTSVLANGRAAWELEPLQFLSGIDIRALDYFFWLFTILGGGLGIYVLTVGIAVTLAARRHRAAAVYVAVSVAGAATLTGILKVLFAMPRPGLADASDQALLSNNELALFALLGIAFAIGLLLRHWHACAMLGLLAGLLAAALVVLERGGALGTSAAGGPGVGLTSFPSGHATSSAALGATLAVLLWPTRLRILGVLSGVLFALAVGYSRLHFGVHFPLDVIAGWSIGIAWVIGLALLVRYVRRLRETRAGDHPDAIA